MFGYRSPLARELQVRRGIFVASFGGICACLVAWGIQPAFVLLLVVGLVQGALVFWRRQIAGTDLQVADGKLTWSSASSSRTFDLTQQPVTAVVVTSWLGPQLRLADGTALPVLRGSDDWDAFVATLERVQGTPIARVQGAGVAETRWYRRNPAGYFEER